MENNKEKYSIEEPPEIRSATDSGDKYIFGYAAVFDSRSKILKTEKGHEFVEEIAPDAFNNTDFSMLRANLNHHIFLAKAPTLETGVDQRGLWYRYKHDPTDPDHLSALAKITRGDITGSSFMFARPLPGDETINKEAPVTVRRITKIRRLFDVGPVAFPAYADTEATVFGRSLDAMFDAEDIGPEVLPDTEPEEPEVPEVQDAEPEAAPEVPEATPEAAPEAPDPAPKIPAEHPAEGPKPREPTPEERAEQDAKNQREKKIEVIKYRSGTINKHTI